MIRRKDLVGISDQDYKERQGEFMLCRTCGQHIGGTRGDYFMIGMNDFFRCSCGSRDLCLCKVTHELKLIRG